MKWKYIKRRFRYNPKRAFLFLSLFLFLTSLTIGYAFLTQTLSIEGTSAFLGATWDIHFENIQVKGGSVTPTTAASITNPTTVTFEVQLDNPGDFYEFNVDVVNDGTFNAMIDSYSFLPVLTAEQQEYLEYTVTYSDGVPLAVYQKLDAGTQETLKIRFGYIDGIDTSLYPLTDQELTIEVEIVYVQADDNAIIRPVSVYEIMKNNAVMDNINSTYVQNATPGIKWDEIASDTNGKGLYLRAGTENDAFPIYYYRGAVDNNNVYFGGFCWKIVRTTETGGLKMIYNGTASGGSCGSGTTSQSGASATIGNSKFNASYKDVKYVGYTYDNSGTETDSTIKGVVDTWYQSNLLTNYDSYLEDTVFCNDRSIHTYSEFTSEEQSALYLQSTYTIYGPTYRLAKKTGPSVTCPNQSDAYTKSSTIGNGKLTYPVGLLTIDEIWMAGEGAYFYGTEGTGYKNTTYYLQNNATWWSLSPYRWGGSFAYVWDAGSGTGLGFYAVGQSNGARPVVSLKPGTVFSGEGTTDNPYTVE